MLSCNRRVTLWVLDIRHWATLIESLLRRESVHGIRFDAATIARFNRYVRREDSVRGAAGELLRKIALANRGGAELSNAAIMRDSFGKPWIPSFPNVHFNISHSGSIVICGVDVYPIGVDVELHRRVDPTLPAQCLTPIELELLRRGDRDPFAFYTIWTVKESLLKGVGRGLLIDPLQVEVAPIDREEKLWAPQKLSVYSPGCQPQTSSGVDGAIRSVLTRMVTRTVDVAIGYSAAVSTCGYVDIRVRHVTDPSGWISLSRAHNEQSF